MDDGVYASMSNPDELLMNNADESMGPHSLAQQDIFGGMAASPNSK